MATAGDIGGRLQDVGQQVRDAIGGQVVHGEPVRDGDVTVIPAARVKGGFGGGGGGGQDEAGDEGSGMGLGFGMSSRPVGAYVIRDGVVRWRPAVDVTRIILAGCAVAIAYFAAVVLSGD